MNNRAIIVTKDKGEDNDALFEMSDEKIFVLKYRISEKIAGEENVYLFAEISDASTHPDQGALWLDIFLGIEPIGMRDFVVGLGFGTDDMTRADIESYVANIIKGQLDGLK